MAGSRRPAAVASCKRHRRDGARPLWLPCAEEAVTPRLGCPTGPAGSPARSSSGIGTHVSIGTNVSIRVGVDLTADVRIRIPVDISASTGIGICVNTDGGIDAGAHASIGSTVRIGSTTLGIASIAECQRPSARTAVSIASQDDPQDARRYQHQHRHRTVLRTPPRPSRVQHARTPVTLGPPTLRHRCLLQETRTLEVLRRQAAARKELTILFFLENKEFALVFEAKAPRDN